MNPAYSPAPEVASEKNILPFEEEPLLIVIPPSPEFATVKSSALALPSVSVPIRSLPCTTDPAVVVIPAKVALPLANIVAATPILN